MLLASSLIPVSANAQSAIGYGVADFDGPKACHGPKSHGMHLLTATIFIEVFKELKTAGKWTSTSLRFNTDVRGSMFTDATKIWPGGDSLSGGADTADVFFLHTHGKRNVNSPTARSTLDMGSSDSDCKVTTDENMLWNNNADIAVIKACQSADRDSWLHGAYLPKFSTTSSSLSVWNGFHGDSSCMMTHTMGDVDVYARSSVGDGVGENWIDEFYASWLGWENDDCPTSIVMGDTKKKRTDMFRFGGFRDRKNTGLKTNSSFFFIAGCSPDHGNELPDD